MECPVGAGPKFNELLRFGGVTQLIESLLQYIIWGFVWVILGICLGDFHAGCWHVDFDVPPPSSSPPHFHGFPHFWDVSPGVATGSTKVHYEPKSSGRSGGVRGWSHGGLPRCPRNLP